MVRRSEEQRDDLGYAAVLHCFVLNCDYRKDSIPRASLPKLEEWTLICIILAIFRQFNKCSNSAEPGSAWDLGREPLSALRGGEGGGPSPCSPPGRGRGFKWARL